MKIFLEKSGRLKIYLSENEAYKYGIKNGGTEEVLSFLNDILFPVLKGKIELDSDNISVEFFRYKSGVYLGLITPIKKEEKRRQAAFDFLDGSALLSVSYLVHSNERCNIKSYLYKLDGFFRLLVLVPKGYEDILGTIEIFSNRSFKGKYIAATTREYGEFLYDDPIGKIGRALENLKGFKEL